jgi:RNA polymerase sigma factor (sigma-70 family)
MDNHDFTKLNKNALLEHFEKERQQWLAEGMSEAAIFRIHFGELDGDGKLKKPTGGQYGGDYQVWLDERKHTRPDHKYAPGAPVAIDTVDPNNAWISDGRSGMDETEFKIDLEAALSKLTPQQRICFVEVVLRERTQQAIADELGITQQGVVNHIKAAKKKLKNYFQG